MILHAAAGVNPLFGQTNKVSAKYLYTHWSELTHILTVVTSNQIQNREKCRNLIKIFLKEEFVDTR